MGYCLKLKFRGCKTLDDVNDTPFCSQMVWQEFQPCCKSGWKLVVIIWTFLVWWTLSSLHIESCCSGHAEESLCGTSYCAGHIQIPWACHQNRFRKYLLNRSWQAKYLYIHYINIDPYIAVGIGPITWDVLKSFEIFI